MTSAISVAGVQRWASALGGAVLAAYGIKHLKGRSPAGAAFAAAGGALMYRGVTGRFPLYGAAGITTVGERGRNGTRWGLSGARGVLVDEVVTIDAPADQLYAFWRDLEDLPRFMHHLVSVTRVDDCRSHWVARGPGRRVEWDTEIINDIPGHVIAWRTVGDSEVVSAGSVQFKPAPCGRGTDVHVRLQYDPPAGGVGATVEWLLGHDPAGTIREELRRFKQLMEAGEIATIGGQPRGKGSILSDA